MMYSWTDCNLVGIDDDFVINHIEFASMFV